MNKEDYIQLQTLLAKLRVECLKEVGNNEKTPRTREKLLKLVRNIDNIRNNMPLKINEKMIFSR